MTTDQIAMDCWIEMHQGFTPEDPFELDQVKLIKAAIEKAIASDESIKHYIKAACEKAVAVEREKFMQHYHDATDAALTQTRAAHAGEENITPEQYKAASIDPRNHHIATKGR
jgi:hypothetical protein